jgi:Response regulators consisting of a CheY-like receiver domain and a winged-helix DNA-binding domain
MSGLDLARRLRKEDLTRDVPIIMLTARGEETDRVGGLEAGVDDYVVKPFSPRELIARINAVMRRTHGVDGDGVVSIGALRIDSGAHRVYAKQEPKRPEHDGGSIEAATDAIVPIGPTEYRLLHFFMTHAERVYSRSQLLDTSGAAACTSRSAPSTCTSAALRKTLEPFGCQDLVQTVRGAGYRFSTTPAE